MPRSHFIVLFSIILFGASAIQAAPGDLDPTFDTDGIVTTAFPGGGPDAIQGLVILSDGKILAAGRAFNGADQSSALARYNTDGSLDPTFGSGGLADEDFAPGFFDALTGLATDSLGRIVVVGSVENATDVDAFAARFSTDGSLDATFGTGGMTVVTIPGTDESIAGAYLTEDLKIVTGGFSGGSFFAVRFNADGGLDTSFDGDGFAISDLTPANDFGRGCFLQPDGKLLVVGDDQASTNLALARYNTDGSLDATFDGDGFVISNLTTADAGSAVLVQPDGKIVAGGRGNLGGNHLFLVVRYNADGSLDTSFDGDGFQTVDIGSGQDIVATLALQEDGKIVAAGESQDVGGGIGIIRLNTDGSLDNAATFSGDGLFLQPFASSDATANSVQIASNGKILVGGTDGDDFTLLRLEGDSSDLRIEIASEGSEVEVGGDLNATLRVTNLGTVAVGGVTLTGTLSSLISLESATPSAGACVVATAACALGTLAAGASVEILAVLRGVAEGDATVEASVSGQVTDIDSTNNTASASVSVTEEDADGGEEETQSGTGGGCSLLR